MKCWQTLYDRFGAALALSCGSDAIYNGLTPRGWKVFNYLKERQLRVAQKEPEDG